jgi:hypothetical protein
MKRPSNPCESWRENICLLAGNALSGAEQIAAQKHLASCADCRAYHDQLRSVTAPLANWEKHFSRLEPQPAMQTRWRQAVLAAKNPEPVKKFSFQLAFVTSWRELIRPCRHAWAAMAALWLVMLGINAAVSHTPGNALSTRSSPPPTTFQVFEEERSVLAELMPPPVGQPIESPRRDPARPRSEKRTRWSMS